MNSLKIDSVVVLAYRGGYVAYLRFSDSSKDRILSNYSKDFLYQSIERHMENIGVGYGND
jgi:hypothetical protein